MLYSTVIKSNFHNIRGSTPKRVTSGGAHLRGLAPGLHRSEGASQRWRAVGDIVPILPARKSNSRPLTPITCSLNIWANDRSTIISRKKQERRQHSRTHENTSIVNYRLVIFIESGDYKALPSCNCETRGCAIHIIITSDSAANDRSLVPSCGLILHCSLLLSSFANIKFAPAKRKESFKVINCLYIRLKVSKHYCTAVL